MVITDSNIWIQAGVLFVSQLIFLYFRTLNVKHTSDLNRKGVFLTGLVVHTCWLITIAIGVTAIIKGNYVLIIFSALGGSLGADQALLKKKRDL